MNNRFYIYFAVVVFGILISPNNSKCQTRQITGTTVIGNITKAEVEAKCPGSTVTLKGADRVTNENIYEVTGDANSIKAALASVKQVRYVGGHEEFSSRQLRVIEKLNDAVIRYAGVAGWRLQNGKWIKGGKHDGSKSKIVLCWVCKQCTEPAFPPMMPPSLKPDCPYPPELEGLYDEWAKWAAMAEVLQQILNSYNFYEFWSGVAGMTKDMVSAAALLLPGAGFVAAKGLNMLLDMAVQGAIGAIMGEIMSELGIPDINSKSACQAALGVADSKRVAANNAYITKLNEYINCQNKVRAENLTIQSQIDEWNKVKDTYLKDWDKYQKCLNDPKRCSWVECK